MGRPRIHASDAARQAARREKTAQIALPVDQAAKLAEIADLLGVPRTELVSNMLRFALFNRNWKQLGLMGSKQLPTESDSAPSVVDLAAPVNKAGWKVQPLPLDQA